MLEKIDINNCESTRESFGRALSELDNDKIVVLDCDLNTSTRTEYFKEKYPNRFIENGIAEADMIGTAAGLATCNKIPFAVGFASFVTGRVYDQIRCSVAYPKLNVKIVGTHSGISVGEDGATHQMLEDINLMRGLPNILVVQPSDSIQTEKLLEQIANIDSPAYLRLSRNKTPIIYEKSDEFVLGKGVQIGEGTDATIFASGVTVIQALKAQKLLYEKDIRVRVCDIHTIKPIDADLIEKCANETSLLFSVEDHNFIGGLGTAISEILTNRCPARLIRLGIQDRFGKSGKAEELIKYFEIDAESIVKNVEENLIK